jgi:hypothetical protein
MQLNEDDISWRVDATYKCFSTPGNTNHSVKKFYLQGTQRSFEISEVRYEVFFYFFVFFRRVFSYFFVYPPIGVAIIQFKLMYT